ncbi:MAG TPA: Fur family transcriptional regulator [Thermomicrobiales bacterium]|nr:Fur family transcriptional regulator [Thermomicrobiales bacterium]
MEMPHQSDALLVLQTRLREQGQRLTPQRLLILDLLHARGDHMTADDLFEAARLRWPDLNLSTVYRSLELFRDQGLIAETDLGDGRRQFALLAADRHHHLICLACHRVEEIGDSYFDELRAVLRAKHGFEARIDHQAIYGLCRECSEAEATR